MPIKTKTPPNPSVQQRTKQKNKSPLPPPREIMTVKCPRPSSPQTAEPCSLSPQSPRPVPRSWAPAAAGGLPPPLRSSSHPCLGLQDTTLPLITPSLSLPDHLSSLTSHGGGAPGLRPSSRVSSVHSRLLWISSRGPASRTI